MRKNMLVEDAFSIVVALAVIAAVAVGAALAQPKPMEQDEPKDKGQTLMRAKLVAAEDLLEAIALQDVDGVANHANQLKLISLDTKWQVLQTLEYRRYGEEFRRYADRHELRSQFHICILSEFRTMKCAILSCCVR